MNEILRQASIHRFEILVGLLGLLALYGSLARLARAGRSTWRRLRRVPGWKVERPWAYLPGAFLLALLCALCAVIADFALTVHGSYQPVHGASRALSLRYQAGYLILKPLGSYPGSQRRVAITSPQWAVRGHFIEFASWLDGFGMQSCHRVDAVLGRNRADQSQPPSILADFGPDDPFFPLILKMQAYLPLVSAHVEISPYLPREAEAQDLFVFGGGYVFVSEGKASEKGQR